MLLMVLENIAKLVNINHGFKASYESYINDNSFKITQWGGIPLSKNGNQLTVGYGMKGEITATDKPTILPNTNLTNMFHSSQNAQEADIDNATTWNVYNGTKLIGFFFYCVNINFNLNNWDTRNITWFKHTFARCFIFNNGFSSSYIGGTFTWDLSNAYTCQGMFEFCHDFNCKLNDQNFTTNKTTRF